MQALQVPERSTFSNYSCQHCSRKALPGQWILHLPAHDTHVKRAIVHARCLRALLADVPDEDDQAFEALRDRIVTTGQAFPT